MEKGTHRHSRSVGEGFMWGSIQSRSQCWQICTEWVYRQGSKFVLLSYVWVEDRGNLELSERSRILPLKISCSFSPFVNRKSRICTKQSWTSFWSVTQQELSAPWCLKTSLVFLLTFLKRFSNFSVILYTDMRSTMWDFLSLDYVRLRFSIHVEVPCWPPTR